ncbi:zinc-dependent alcohol dehydrogenase family protein [Variovorax guangxiensis]|uniref:Alcohol dehydrogenase n=1 Tax=Variovorax guangxiensis TaxID=1775474 RepID=A0A502DV16_9BURK|nr:zinc-dependent alcohol dehydrogenase family protein [Variovorax guangxiensis]RZI69221.1 MAG: alcohol dehydrogenase [Variovorax sp.]TPG25054.1 alcohol dehydrogenase [Variovorax ginsengisoli]TPG29305.1 alcohol dehydrogenase [Variovorax guangxiensis]
MKIRAAVLEKIGAAAPYAQSLPLRVQEVELDPPGPGEVLVRIRAAGLCHSDLSVINGSRPRPTPMVLGHESAGEVVEVANDVRDLRPGDRVVLVFVPSCGGCVPCAEGRPALCEPGAVSNTAGTLLSGERRLHIGETRLNHHTGVSCFAEYAVVSRRSCVKLEADISFAEAALFGCAVLTGVGAVINTARVQAGSTVAVLGLGGVGLNALLAAVASGAREIVAIDLNEDKLALARELGATMTVNASDEGAATAIRTATHGGVDYAFEMAGSIKAMELAYLITRRGGTTITAGLPSPEHKFSFSPVSLVGEERTLRGSYIGSSVPVRDIARYVDLYQRGKLPVNRLMGEQIGLADINAGFDRLATGHSLRDVVVF